MQDLSLLVSCEWLLCLFHSFETMDGLAKQYIIYCIGFATVCDF